MTSMMKYFKDQMRQTVHPGAVKKLWAKAIPQMCVDHDICPACAGDLKMYEDFRSPFMHAQDKKCAQCEAFYKGGQVDLPRRQYTKPETSFQKGSFIEGT